MFDEIHLADEVGHFPERLGRVAAGQDELGPLRFHLQDLQDIRFVQHPETDGGVDLVEDDQLILILRKQILDDGQSPLGFGLVFRSHTEAEAVRLRIDAVEPRRPEIDLAFETLGQNFALAVMRAAFIEIHDGDFHPLGDGADRHAQGGSRLAFAVAGVELDQAVGFWTDHCHSERSEESIGDAETLISLLFQ